MKGISLKGRLSKKLLIGVAGVLVLAGGAGGYLLMSGRLAEHKVDAEASSPSGVACTTTDFIKLNRGGQRWLRKYVRTDSPDGIERVRTALRVAGVLAQSEKADLYQVVVLDQAGPQGRANLRGAAIGAEVLFAPDPSKLPDMPQPFIARYMTGKANSVGLFYGERTELSADEIRTALAGMTDRTDCQTLVADAAAPVESDALAGHGKPAGHGAAEAAEGHGDAKAAEGHGAADEAGEHGAPVEGHETGHASGETAPADGHASTRDAPSDAAHGAATETAEGGHAEPAASEGGGWLSTVTNLIPGMGSSKTETGHDAPASSPADAKRGVLATVLRFIPGMGGQDPAAPAGGHDTETAKEGGIVEQAGPGEPLLPAGHGEQASPAAHGEPMPTAGHGEQAAHGEQAGPSGSDHPVPDATQAEAAQPAAQPSHDTVATKHETAPAVTVPEATAETALGTEDHAPVTLETEHDAAASHTVAPEETGATH